MLRTAASSRAAHACAICLRSGRDNHALQVICAEQRNFCKRSEGDPSNNQDSDKKGEANPESDVNRAAAAAKQAAADAASKAAVATSNAAKKAAAATSEAKDFVASVAQEMLKTSPFRASPGDEARRGKPARPSANEDRQASSSGTSSSEGQGVEGADRKQSAGAGGSKFPGSGFSAPEFARRLLSQARRIIPNPTSWSTSGSAAGESGRADIVAWLRSEAAQAVLPVHNLPSVMKRRTDVAGEVQVGEGSSDLVVTEVSKSWYDRLSEQMGSSALMQRIRALRETEAARRVAEGYEDVKEKLEHSDSEVIGRFQDMRQRMGEENEAAVTYREIRLRHPSFDMPNFLHAIKQDVPIVIKAYLEGSQGVLEEYCSNAMLERLLGIYQATKAQGQITDSTILEFSDVDMVDMKMLESDPVIILHFSCQQINCVRDQYGNVVSGAPDDVNRVYYYWAVQQEGVGSVSTTGEYIPPRWKLTEMLLRGMHQLL